MASTGLPMYSQLRFQTVPETTAGIYDPAQPIDVLTMFKIDRKPEEAFSEFRPQGFNEDAWSALVRHHEICSGTIRPDFGQMPALLTMLCGAGVLQDDNKTTYYTNVDSGARSIITKTLEYGSLAAGKRLPYGLLQSFSLQCQRSQNDFQGNVSFVARKPNPETDVPLSADGGVTGTDLTSGVTATGTSTNPAHLCDDDATNNASFTTGQTGIVDLTTAKTVIALRVKKASTGGHASGVLKLQGSNDSFTNHVDLWSITDTSDANWASATWKERVFSNIVGYRYLRLIYTTGSGSLAIGELELFDAITASAVTLPAPLPMLPQNLSIMRADTLDGLDDEGVRVLDQVNEVSLEFQDLVQPHYFFDENNITFISHVDGEPKMMVNVKMANNEQGGSDCVVLYNDSRAQPARPKWWRFKWTTPDGTRAFWIDLYASVHAPVNYSSNNNIYEREFPLTAKLNGQGWIARFATYDNS